MIDKKNSKINYQYIVNQTQLDFLTDLIYVQELIAIDTEFTRSSTYYPILSIIQLAIKSRDQEKLFYIIDCYCDLDFTKFFRIICDQKIKKILHSSLQDLQIFFQKNPVRPQAIIDTQILANLSGFKANIGYADLVEQFFGKVIDKKMQNSDWHKRPLTNRQLEYAITDVLYLHEIYQKLQTNIENLDRQEFYLEDIEKFIDHALQDNKNNLIRKILSSKRNLQDHELLKNLIIWREDQARILDIPRQHLISDKDLQKIAENKIIDLNLIDKISEKNLVQLKQIIELSCNDEIKKNYNQEIKKEFLYELINQDYLELSLNQKQIFLEAKKIVNQIANQLKISEQFLLTSNDLKKIIIASENQQVDLRLKILEIIGKWRSTILFEALDQILTKRN